MTTYIALDVSAAMFPAGSTITTSPLTPDQVKDRLAKVAVVSLLGPAHAAAIETIKQRFGLELPMSAKLPVDNDFAQPLDLFIIFPKCLHDVMRNHNLIEPLLAA